MQGPPAERAHRQAKREGAEGMQRQQGAQGEARKAKRLCGLGSRNFSRGHVPYSPCPQECSGTCLRWTHPRNFSVQRQQGPVNDASASTNKHLRELHQRWRGRPSQRKAKPFISMFADLKESARLKHPLLSQGERRSKSHI